MPKNRNKIIEITKRLSLRLRIDSVKKAIIKILGVIPTKFNKINLVKETSTKEHRIFCTTKGIKVKRTNKIDLFGFSLTIFVLIKFVSSLK
tara:strand:+ start:140 stop:412 length:273 start_codon:yes stop_codon:yes gene_type:complete